MTLDELSEAWNELRNAALGRGTTPNVKPVVAAVVGQQYEDWRKALKENEWPTDDMAASLTASRWVTRYREVLALVRGQGIEPGYVLPKSTLEQLEDVASGAVSTAAAVAGLVVAVTLIAPFIAWARRKGRGGS